MEKIGIDWKIILGQIINFAIILFLLKKFAYRRFLDILDNRKKKIGEGLKKSEDAQKLLSQIKSMSERMKEDGEQEQKKLLEEARSKARILEEEILVRAQKERDKIIAAGKKSADAEAEKGREERERAMVEMAFLSAEKILKEKIDRSKDQKIIKEILSEKLS